ncbi:hypothetical protein [Carnobacterium maltaromaticum]|uniref:hypothetical protein n=1 Tax=Carnobacterium maltaromaticum TaxID=2751 RepID=UPI001072530B|nr:hypothetical protein [Carnobacterium maltaromaticum]TFJ70007.1 hypothetical protein CKN94_15805 [Carnobacterium maltaromaticum]TFJ75927.1 hypothetical protein CKN97_15795 [Carnobacterium maltaromaticum]
MTEKKTNEEEIKKNEEEVVVTPENEVLKDSEETVVNTETEITPAKEDEVDTETVVEDDVVTEEVIVDEEVASKDLNEVDTTTETTATNTTEEEILEEGIEALASSGVVEGVSIEGEEIDGEFEEDLEDDDLEDEEPKGKLAKHMGKILYSLLGIMIVAVLIFGYYVFPFFSKIGGTWQGENTAGTFKIVNKGSKSEFSFVDMNGVKGMNLVFTSELTRKGVNQFGATDTSVKIVLDKKTIDEANIKAFKELTDQVKFKDETDKEVVLVYTKAAYETAFKDTNLDEYFNYRLTNFNFALQGKDLMLKNKDFATPEVNFTRK